MDGGIGLAPGTDGFKSYVEYLIERKSFPKTLLMFSMILPILLNRR